MLSLVTGRRLRDAEVRDMFNGLSRPGRPDYLSIEPMIIARDLATAAELLSGLSGSAHSGERSATDDNVIPVDFADDGDNL